MFPMDESEARLVTGTHRFSSERFSFDLGPAILIWVLGLPAYFFIGGWAVMKISGAEVFTSAFAGVTIWFLMVFGVVAIRAYPRTPDTVQGLCPHCGNAIAVKTGVPGANCAYCANRLIVKGETFVRVV